MDRRPMNEEEEEDRKWLELSLGGLGSATDTFAASGTRRSSSSSAMQDQSYDLHQHDQLGLGLGFQLGSNVNDHLPRHDVRMTSSSSSRLNHDSASTAAAPISLMSMPISSSWPPLMHQEEEEDDDDDSLLNTNNLIIHHHHHHHHLPPPAAGLWFTLISLPNQNGESLAHLPKPYIRVKEENMTVFMVKKYLVTKLGLANEAQVDISCMGHKLLQWQSLKNVRDGIWLPSLLQSSLNYNNVNYLVMSLHYQRSCY